MKYIIFSLDKMDIMMLSLSKPNQKGLFKMKKQSSKQQASAHLQLLKAKYPYIAAYSKIMGSYDYWTEMQLYNADKLNAPEDTYNVDLSKGTYTRIGEIKNQALVNELKYYANK